MSLLYEQMKDYKHILNEKYEAFDWEEKPIMKTLLRTEVFNILRNIPSPDTDDLHIWGLTHYKSTDDQEYHKRLALEKFLEAYELDSQNFLACLYIAHCYHDTEELEKALTYYELVDKEDLKEFQVWRYVKLIEQIGYCQYKLGDKELGRQKFQTVLEWYRKLPMDERAIPVEMLACLPDSDEIVIEMKQIEDYLD